MSEEYKDSHEIEEKVKNKRETKPEMENNNESVKAEDKEKPVIIKAEAYKTIILYANRFANNAIPSSEWKEIYGVLIGYDDDDFVHVIKAEALNYGHSTDVQLDEKHYVFIANIQEELANEGDKYYIVGWFHSHPGLNLFFSYVDIINQLGFQDKNKDAIGLVYDHTLLGRKKKEQIIDEEGIAHEITKYDTGFEIYRITDVYLDHNDPNYENNYHEVDYVIEGLNKYFFANLMAELSERAYQGKPLQSAYGENWYNDQKNIIDDNKIDMPEKNRSELFEAIPMDEDIVFTDDTASQKSTLELIPSKNNIAIEQAEKFIHEGLIAFKNNDSVSGVDNFKKGIDIYEHLGLSKKVLELWRDLIQKCINNKHYILAEEFSDELYDLAEKEGDLFYLGEANYLNGYLLLKRDDKEVLKSALKNIEKAAINFEKEKDFVGAGLSFEKIGMIYLNRLNVTENSCLFIREAIENYNKGILKSHPLRTSLWGKPEMLIQKIKELKDLVEELIPKVKNSTLKQKIIQDMKSIQYNF